MADNSVHCGLHFTTLLSCTDCYIEAKKTSLATRCGILGCVIARKVGDVGLTAAFLQRVGDINMSFDSDTQTAKCCYNVTMEYLRYHGAWRHLADSVLRLRLVSLLEGERKDSELNFSTAYRFYIHAEDPEGCHYCEAWLEDCEDPVQKLCSFSLN